MEYTDKYIFQIKKIGNALSNLRDNPNYKVIESYEQDQLEDLKTISTSIPISDSLYHQKVTYNIGMVTGLRRWIDQKKKYLAEYKTILEKEQKSNDHITRERINTDTAESVASYGHIRGRSKKA